MPVDEIEFRAGGLRIAARCWGQRGDPPLLAIHGWLDNAASFDRLAPLLENRRIVAVDLPGHGHSDHRSQQCSYHFCDWPVIVLDIADALGWERFDIIGHSMGAGIASLVPAVAPGRVRAMVLLEGAGPLSRSAEEAPGAFAEALSRERTAPGRGRVFADLDAAVRARLLRSDLARDAAQLIVARGVIEDGEGFRFCHDPRLQLPSRIRLTEDQVWAFLAAIDCPVLAMRARPGWPFPEGMIANRVATIPGIECFEVNGGHHVHLENPRSVASEINRFLKLNAR